MPNFSWQVWHPFSGLCGFSRQCGPSSSSLAPECPAVRLRKKVRDRGRWKGWKGWKVAEAHWGAQVGERFHDGSSMTGLAIALGFLFFFLLISHTKSRQSNWLYILKSTKMIQNDLLRIVWLLPCFCFSCSLSFEKATNRWPFFIGSQPFAEAGLEAQWCSLWLVKRRP